MADNTNAQAIEICNQKIRVAAEKILGTYHFMKMLQMEYTAQNWAALFPAGDPTGEIIDQSRVDGRPIITNGNVNDVITALGAFISWMEATSNQQRDRFLKVAPNPERA